MKDEVDIAFSASETPTRVYSRSCTVESKTAPPAIPAALKARLAPCSSTVTRLKVDLLKIEQWTLPGGRTAIEVSRTGPDTADEANAFWREIVDPLIRVQKIQPLRESKTEMGSDCHRPKS